MISRDEIVSWLRDAGKVEVASARVSGAGPKSYEFAIPWNTRAAQVEAMRCKTCAKRITSKPLYPGSGSFLVEHCPWQDCGGCFNHESKEGE